MNTKHPVPKRKAVKRPPRKPAKRRAKSLSPDEQKAFDRRMRIWAAAERALGLLERMESDGGARLPYPNYTEIMNDLRKALK